MELEDKETKTTRKYIEKMQNEKEENDTT